MSTICWKQAEPSLISKHDPPTVPRREYCGGMYGHPTDEQWEKVVLRSGVLPANQNPTINSSVFACLID